MSYYCSEMSTSCGIVKDSNNIYKTLVILIIIINLQIITVATSIVVAVI